MFIKKHAKTLAEVNMEGISLTLMRDPQLRESLRSAQTSGQKVHILQEAGFSASEIHTAAKQTAKFHGHIFQGKLGSGGTSY
ncbi:MAG: hypothetical protein K1000chlam1_00126 [Candidatus Anoxychlamydiales bacterium]|nr:hypothetical protein [Candidatus Anoxychlamydiales bacterium]